jgi:uncharacterized protein (DUF305 family)
MADSFPARPAASRLVLFVVGLSACASGARTAPEPVPASSAASAPAMTPEDRVPRATPQSIAEARADSARTPYTAADVKFMTDMIGHHAQAIRMSLMAPSHGASPQVRTLAARIINAQRDEIFNMQQWLADRQKPWPHVDATGAVHGAGTDHAAHHGGSMMAGMLTDAQMAQLDAARGAEFDRLFLTYMIQHHQGAVAMVKDLLSHGAAAHNDTVFRLAGDINVDQTTEIARMKQMLAELTSTQRN